MTTLLPPPPPFDPELGAALGVLAEQVPSTLTPEMIPMMRSGIALATVTDEELRRDGRFDVEERAVPGPDGDPDISLLICRPTAPATSSVGCVYFTHGGGMIIGDRRTGVIEALDWADEFGMVVVSVEYRLAPETPHPGPIEDCYAGLVWTAAHAAELGFDPDRMIVAGGSAGGGLAAALALMARDRGGPELLGQMLIYPMLDDRNDLSHLPPAFIDVGTAETFRDEDVTYASRIWHAGGRAELHVWPGGFHGFDVMVPTAAISRDARAARVRWLRRLLDA